jgi:ABC-type uncharacterized transport system substrate-binding protein
MHGLSSFFTADDVNMAVRMGVSGAVCLRLGGLLVTLAVASAAGEAHSHPHVWINNVTSFVFEGRQLVGVHHRWEFDELFGSAIIDQHDADGDGSFNEAEAQTLRDAAFSNLEAYGYFTHLRVDGNEVALDQVAEFEPDVENGALVYEFMLRLPEPLDPAIRSLVLGVYDEEYYVEVLLDAEDPVRFVGLPGGACIFDIREDTEHPIYYGMVYPLVIGLSCANS